MHLRAVKLLPLLCACFISPCILHPTPHTEFPFLVLWVFDSPPPPFYSHTSILPPHTVITAQCLSPSCGFFSYTLCLPCQNQVPFMARVCSNSNFCSIYSLYFSSCLGLSVFFFKPPFFPQFLSMLFPIYPLSGTICQSWFIVRILSAISLSLFYISVAYKTSDLLISPFSFSRTSILDWD